MTAGLRMPPTAAAAKTEEKLRGEGMFWKWVRGTVYSLIALIVFCYWYGEVVVRPGLRAAFENIFQAAR